MRHLLAAAVLLALPAVAQTFTTPSGDYCTVTCSGRGAPAPAPAPAPTPSPAPAPAPSPSVPPATCGSAYESRAIGNKQGSVVFSGQAGTVYAFEIPKAGFTYSGYFTLADTVGTPQELEVELSISSCPGDMSKAATPCGGKFGPSANLNWAPSGSFYQCATSLPGPWYINMRFVKNCRTETTWGGVSDPSSCRIVYSYSTY